MRKKSQNILFYTLVSLLITVSLFSAVFLFSGWGLRYSLHHTTRFIPGHLEIGSSSGYLGSHFVLNDVHFYNEGIDIKIKRFEISWVPLYFLRKQYLIQKLELTEATCNLLESETGKKGFADFLDVWLRRIVIENAHLIHVKLLERGIARSFITHAFFEYGKGNNQFYIELPKGVIQGKYILEHFPHWKWNIKATGANVDTNFLWNNTDAIITFDLITGGEWIKEKNHFNFEIPHLVGTVRGFPLNGSVKIYDENDQIIINSLDLSLGKAKVFVKGEAFKKWNLIWQIEMPNLNHLNKVLSGNLFSNGQVQSINDLPYVSGKILGRGLKLNNYGIDLLTGTILSNIQENTLFLNLHGQGVKIKNFNVPSVHMTAISKFLSHRIQHHLTIIFSNTNKMWGILNTPNFLKPTTGDWIQGKLNVKFNDLSQLVLPSNVKFLGGMLFGEISLNGKLSKINYKGYLDLKNAGFFLSDIGINPKIIQARANFNNNLLGVITGQFQSGNGLGTINGTIDLNKADFPLRLLITGNNLQIANTPEYNITASPHLTLTMTGEEASVTGNVVLPYIRIATDEYNKVLKLPTELEFAHVKKKPIQYFKDLALRFDLQIGQDAYIAYRNLRARLAGNITVFQIPGGFPSANGALVITEGYYRIYDKLFSINEGRLIYAGNLLSDPGLSIRAIVTTGFPKKNFLGFGMATETDRMKAGVLISGTLSHPTTELVSEPLMSQDDILSHIVFGQPRANINGIGALSLLGSLTTQLSVNEPTLKDAEVPESGFYGFFKMGIFNPVEVFNFILPIGANWKIQTETTLNETGADLLYDYEAP